MKGTITAFMVMSLALAWFWSTDAYATEIYKTIDENGDPVYTDRPPTPESKPISLRQLSVVEAPDYGAIPARQQSQSDPANGAPSMNQMRRTFREFRLVSPVQDQNIWGTSNTVTIAWDAGAPLESGMSVIFYIDGQPVGDATQSSTYTSARLDRGTHTARVDLLNSENRVVVSTPMVTFNVMQQSVNNRAR